MPQYISLDNLDKKILAAISKNSRITVKALSEEVSLSQPSCAERLKKLSDRGVIQRYTLEISEKALGYPITAIVRIQPLAGKIKQTEEQILITKEIVQCDKVTGDYAFICRMHLKSIDDLDNCLNKISKYATTSTSIVKSSPLKGRLLPLS